MAILYHESSRCFHLYNQELSYIIHIMANGQLENLYYGKRIADREDFRHFHEETIRSQLSVCQPEPSLLSMHYARQEFPVYGTGDYRSPALCIRQQNGSRTVNFVYHSHSIDAGKPSLSPLPATYVDEPGEAESLCITLTDSLMQTELQLSYTLYNELPVLTRNARLIHHGDEPIAIEQIMSASVEFLDMDFEMLQLSGGWGRERYVRTRPLQMGTQGIQSLNGTCSGAEHNPFLALKRPSCTESQGEVYGFSLIYSSNFLAQAEVSTFDMTRVMMGINPQNFEWPLAAGESFQTPELVMVYSDGGLNKMSQTYHRLYRSRLMRGYWRDKARPVLLNNWEATYFNFDEDKLLHICRKAKEVGVELFVLDDGWFGARNDDYRGLGDWYVNLQKLPEGIAGLSRKVEAMGMKFGLWVELEMVNKDSELYRTHPDWLIHTPGRFESHARHQHVLDFSRQEVVDYIYGLISKVIRESRISYIKWDMNRYMTEPYSVGLPADRQGEMMHRYILGVYELYTRLTGEFPEILFESCASGGARFDPAMLYFAPQTWTSDDSDAAERVKIQYGTSYVYPLVSMGSHVSAVPNHQVFRMTPLESRANVAYFGTFGYELDLNLLSEAELELVKEQVRFMKQYRQLIQVDGDFHRLLNPFEGNEAGWIVVSPDLTEALAMFFQRLNKVNASWLRFRLTGLNPDALYTVSYNTSPNPDFNRHLITQYGYSDQTAQLFSYTASGSELVYAGIPIDRTLLSFKGGDFASLLFTLKQQG